MYFRALLVWNIEENRRLFERSKQSPSFVTPIGSSHLTKVISIKTVSEPSDSESGKSVEEEVR